MDKKTLRKPEPKKPELPAKPLPEIEAMNNALNQLIEIFRTSKDVSGMTDKIISLLASRIEAVESKVEKKKPNDWEFDVKRDGKGFISKVNARAV